MIVRSLLWLAATAASGYVIIIGGAVIGWMGLFSLVPVLAFSPLETLAFRKYRIVSRTADVVAISLLVLDIAWAVTHGPLTGEPVPLATHTRSSTTISR